MAADEPPIITLKDVYCQLSKLVGHMQAVDMRNTAADEIHRDHETRLRLLERWRYGLPISLMMSGGAAVASGLAVLQQLTS